MIDKYEIAAELDRGDMWKSMHAYLFGRLDASLDMWFRGVMKHSEIYATHRAVNGFMADYRALVEGGMTRKDAIHMLASAHIEAPAGSESPAGQGRTTPRP